MIATRGEESIITIVTSGGGVNHNDCYKGGGVNHNNCYKWGEESIIMIATSGGRSQS